jgi:ABC-type lipoprotein export system ATPase subunit
LSDQPPVTEVLEVDDLWKDFLSRNGRRVAVLRGISFSVIAGEAVAITGASGAGKSTLLHLVAGFEAPDRGTIKFGPAVDRDAGARPSTATPPVWSIAADCQIGFVFQFHHLLPDLNALENVSLPLRIARLSRAESERRAHACLSELGLHHCSSQRLGELSGGEQQRVALARALVGTPKLVMADEPTGNLDADTGEQIARILVDYGRRRQAVVLIATHNERLAQLCDRVLLLRDGRIESCA